MVAAAPIPRGMFVAEYVGEVVTNGEAAARLAGYDAASVAAAAAGRRAGGHALLVGHQMHAYACQLPRGGNGYAALPCLSLCYTDGCGGNAQGSPCNGHAVHCWRALLMMLWIISIMNYTAVIALLSLLLPTTVPVRPRCAAAGPRQLLLPARPPLTPHPQTPSHTISLSLSHTHTCQVARALLPGSGLALRINIDATR